MSAARRICLGAFAGAHGVRGDVKVKTFTARPEDVAAYGVLESEDGKQRFTLNILRVLKEDLVLARAREIKTREDAAALSSMRLYAPRAALPPAEEDEFYYEDLVGLDAVDEAGKAVGRVVAVHNFGAGDLIEIKAVSGPTEMIPFSKARVPAIDLASRRLVVAAAKEVTLSDETGEIVSDDIDVALAAMREEDA